MADIGKAYVQIEPTAKGISGKIEKELGGAGESGGKAFNSGFGKVLGTTGKVMAGALAAGTAAVGTFGKAAITAGSEYESAFAQVQTIMDSSVMSTEDMSNAIQNLSSDMGISANELSNTVYNAISATGDTANAVSLAGQASKLATAGFTDTGSALSVLTTAMNAYGMSADEAANISDSLIAVQNLGVTTVSELSSSMGKAIASASAYNVDLNNLESAYVSLTKGGINTAESTTYISSMLKELGSDGSKVSEIIKKETGKSFADLMNDGKTLGDVLGVLNDSVNGDASALMNLWSSAEAGKASNAILTQGLDQFNDNLKSIAGSAGMTQTAYETMADTLEHKTDVFKTLGTNLLTSVYSGMSGELGEFVDFGNQALQALSDGFKSGGVSGLMDALGTVLSDAISMIIDKLPDIINAGMELIAALGQGIIDNLPSVLSAVGEIFMNIATAISESLPTLIPTIVQTLIDIGMYLIDNIDILINAMIQVWQGLTQGIIAALPILVQKLPEILLKIGNALIENIPILIQAAFECMVQLGAAIIEYGPQLIMALLEVLMQLGQTLVEYGAQFLQAADTVLSNLINGAKTWLAQLPTMAAEFAGQMVGKFLNFITQLPSKLSQIWTNITNAVKSFGQRFAQQGPQMAKDFKEKLVTKLKELPQKMLEIGKDIVNGLLNGIKNAWSNLTGAVGDMAKSFVDGLKKEFKIGSPSKVMAEEVGKWIPAGIAEGIESGMGLLNSAVDDITTSVKAPTIGVMGNYKDVSSYSPRESVTMSQESILGLLAQYLPIIASGENVNVTLDVDNGRLFKIVQQEQKRNNQLVGVYA